MFPSVLIVDDESSIRQSLDGILSDEGFEVSTAANGYEGLKIIASEAPDIVLLDIWMQGMDGIETLKEIKKENPNIPVILISGHGTIETAVKATKMGAFDLIEKPLSIDKVILAINNALNFRRLEEENQYLRKKTIEKHSITGGCSATQILRKQIAETAPTDSWVLISGENGTGKELVARTIHNLSTRADKAWVDVNCAAIPDNMIDSELFGHEKGAIKENPLKKVGKFEIANKGTLFFDEIGDMNLATQAKILRVLQEKQFQRVGSSRTIHVDVRVLAATNKNLELEIKEGRFREDLYFRLNVIPIQVPPLRERQDDIPLLVETFLSEFAKQSRRKPKEMSPEAISCLRAYLWPGNVRELRNLIERLSITGHKQLIEVTDLPTIYSSVETEERFEVIEDFFAYKHLKEASKAFEAVFIQRKLKESAGDFVQTARSIGLETDVLEKKVKELKEKG